MEELKQMILSQIQDSVSLYGRVHDQLNENELKIYSEFTACLEILTKKEVIKEAEPVIY